MRASKDLVSELLRVFVLSQELCWALSMFGGKESIEAPGNAGSAEASKGSPWART